MRDELLYVEGGFLKANIEDKEYILGLSSRKGMMYATVQEADSEPEDEEDEPDDVYEYMINNLNTNNLIYGEYDD